MSLPGSGPWCMIRVRRAAGSVQRRPHCAANIPDVRCRLSPPPCRRLGQRRPQGRVARSPPAPLYMDHRDLHERFLQPVFPELAAHLRPHGSGCDLHRQRRRRPTGAPPSRASLHQHRCTRATGARLYHRHDAAEGVSCGGSPAGRSRAGRPQGSWRRDGRRRRLRPARFCQAQTPVLAEQFSSREHDAFRVPYLSDKAPEDEFHGQAVKTVA